ncbi:unnamed protein product, partial [Meganyctiphanes norvegica]
VQYENQVVLPEGWSSLVKMRTRGLSTGYYDIYYISPKGQKLRSVKEVEKYCMKEGIEVDLSMFRRSSTLKTTKPPKSSKDDATPSKKRGRPKGSTKAKKQE